MSNPLTRYRNAQRRARALFEPFTQVHCATCATPCCQKPARLRPIDLVLVEELGYRLPAPAGATPEGAAPLVDAALRGRLPEAAEPCDYLGPQGCVFPADLRPFGCVAFICEPMRRALSPEEMAPVEAAVAELETAHGTLMQALHAP
jgi:hypothetical protein